MTLQQTIRTLPRFLQRHSLIKAILALAPKARRQLIRFNGGSQAIADISDSAVRDYFLKTEFEPEFFEIARPLLSSGGIFFDIGANFGFCTFGLLGAQSGSRVHCHLFEANEAICEYLRASRELHPESHIEIIQAVVTDKPGETRFEVNSAELTWSTVSENGGTSVRNVVLDDYIQQQRITCVDFAKMDIEGWEPAALKGAVVSLRAGIFKAIYFEVIPALLASHGFSPSDSFAILRDCGYEIFFCKVVDRQNREIELDSWKERIVSGVRMQLAPVVSFPTNCATDLLAVHHTALI